jgi:hypothetical protein
MDSLSSNCISGKNGIIGPMGTIGPMGIIGVNGPIGKNGNTGQSGILMAGIEVVFSGSESDSIFASLTEGNRYFVENNYGSSTHVTLVDDLGKLITIRSGNFVSISGWRAIQLNKIL